MDPKDLYADINIPFGTLAYTDRYQEMVQMIDLYKPTRLVGHSLSGSEILEYQKRHPNMDVKTYGAPVLDLNFMKISKNRLSNYFDPISMFDWSAKKQFSRNINPHSY